MKIPTSNTPPINQAIQSHQNRLQDLRQNRTVSPDAGYHAVSASASGPRSVAEWKAILDEKKAAVSKAAANQNVSTVLLGKPDQSAQKIERLPVPLPSALKIPPPSTALVSASFQVNPEIRAIGESLGSVLEKLLSFPPPPTRLNSPPDTLPTATTEIALRSAENEASLDHLVFPGEEPEGDEVASLDALMQAPLEPIFPRVERLDHIVFPPEKPKAQLLLERQTRDDKNPKK